MINNVTLVGRMTKAAELRYSQTGTAVAAFTIAINRFGKNDETDFINCVAFKKTAEALANYTDKGSLIGLTGSIQVRTYEKDGQKRWVTEVIANGIQFLDTKKKQDNESSSYSQQRDQSPAGHKPFTDDPFANDGKPIDISDDDLPF